LKLYFTNTVKSDYLNVKEGFDQRLFEALAPFFLNLKVLYFDGCQKDNKFKIQLGYKPFVVEWEGLVTESLEQEDCFYFIDEGIKLPFPLKKWKHIHTMKKIDNLNTQIIDDIFYTTNNVMVDFLIYPAIFFQFYVRKFGYKEYYS
jgi:ligand-binding SRPBCC domain-containing protein